MQITYTLLRPDLDVWQSASCDSFKFEVHPVTGKVTLQMLEIRGSETKLTSVITGVVTFNVQRP